MSLLNKIRPSFNLLFANTYLDAVESYNRIAKYYDYQENLLLELDEIIFKKLLANISTTGKTVVDVGCGTGRHWQYLLSQEPKTLIGFDVSQKMLDILHSKYLLAKTYVLKNNTLEPLADKSCDIIILTLTIGYIENIGEVFTEWKRVLKTGGEMIITDYHPELLRLGGNRKFEIEGKSISAKNYVHTIKEIEKTAADNGFNIERLHERYIDETVRPYYDAKNALHIYNKFQGAPIIYGIHLKKSNAAA